MADPNDPIMQQIAANMSLVAAQGVPAQVRAQIGDAALQSQRVVLSDPYYSAISVEPSTIVTASGTSTYTFNKGIQSNAFLYGVGDPGTIAGFQQSASGQPYAQMTIAETNVKNKGLPNAGKTLLVWGLSFIMDPSSEPTIAGSLFENLSVLRLLNGGDQRRELGTLSLIPGSGGLYGAGISSIQQPPLADTNSNFGFASNGLPGRDNMLVFPEPWYWRPAGSTDSDLAIVCTLERTVVLSAIARAAATGVAAFVPPTTIGNYGTYLRGKFVLHSFQSSSRSVNE
jgi:hypothetical protein